MAESTATETDTEISMDCYICKDFFNRKDHRPKILPCGHNVCASCINKLVQANAQTCPFCRQDFNCEDASDYPTDLNVVRRVKGGIPSKKQSKEADTSTKDDDQWSHMFHSTQTKHKADCQETIARLANAEMNITKEKFANVEVSNNLVAANKRINFVIDNLKRIEESNTYKMAHLQGVRSNLEIAEKIKTELVNRVKDIEVKSESAEDFSYLGCVTDELRNINKGAKDFEEKLYKVLPDLKTTRNAMEEEHQKWSKKIDSIVCIARFEDERKGRAFETAYLDLSHKFAALTAFEDDLLQNITVDDIREMKEPIKRRIKEGKIFVIVKQQQRQMISQLCFTEDNEVLLPHVEEGKALPPDSHVVECSEIMQMVDPSSLLTFVDFEEGQGYVGRVFFRLYPNTRLGRLFFLKCSGEIRTSFEGDERCTVECYDRCNVLERLHITLRETTQYMQSNAVRRAIQCSTWSNPMHLEELNNEGPLAAGKVSAYYHNEYNNGVSIYTNNHPHCNVNGVIGDVYKGLDVVKRICTNKHKVDVLEYLRGNTACRIKDCGVVIHAP